MPGNSAGQRSLTILKCWLIILLMTALQGTPASCWGRVPPSSGKVVVVCDGDTIVLDSGEKIRYLGVDAPEVAHDRAKADCFGDEAKRMNSGLVLHKQVSLQYEREVLDPHGRFLAYVILPDGRCANLEMLRAGSAYVYRTSKDFGRLTEFLQQQRQAILQRQGMWGGCPVRQATTFIGNRRSFVFHRPECALGKKVATRARNHFPDRWVGLEQGYRPCRFCKP